MKNKKLLHILFVIFSMLAINAVSSEEIIFETPEIESSNNGDILKAYKGGKAIINKEVEIIGDRFEYNRKNEILSVEGNVKINDSINNITTDAEKVIYFKIRKFYMIIFIYLKHLSFSIFNIHTIFCKVTFFK